MGDVKLVAEGVDRLANNAEAVEFLGQMAGWKTDKVRSFLKENHVIIFHSIDKAKADKIESFLAERGVRVKTEQSMGFVTVTTTANFENRKITQYMGPVFAECASSINIFHDLFAEVRDIVGGRSKALQKELKILRLTVLEELRKEAAGIGADAVVGVDFDYMEYREGMLILIANGTAVKTEEA